MTPSLAILLALTTTQTPTDDLATELPRLKPTEPSAALATFRVHPGFKLIQVAAEPLVADPVAACFDADQRLYVVEMGDYPFRANSPDGRVRLLEDRDNDGRYETSTIFLDKLAWPTSVVPHDGGVFIAAAPDILYAKDSNGDGVADIRKVAFTGFGIGNVQALVNGLIWGLDGWIYGASGGNGGDITAPDDPDRKPINLRGRDFRFKADGSAFETLTGGGQFGNTFDDWGHRFVCNNSNHIRQVVLESRYLERNPDLIPPPILVDIAAEGPAAKVFRISPAEPWRLIRTRQRAADPAMVRRLPPTELFPIGFFTSATGATIYRGSAFGPEFEGNVFIGDVGGNLVHRKRLEPNGVIFQATRADSEVEFLASTDNWFRPVNFLNTPDGTLLILDMYRETIEHPDSIPDPIKQHLELTSGRDRGRIYNLVPERFRRRPRLRLSQATNAELVNLLADPDAYWRETAQRLLIERPDRDTVPMLRSLLASTDNDHAKLHALWTLQNLNALRVSDVETAIQSPTSGLRENVARLLESLIEQDPSAETSLITLADDTDPIVRFQAALSLSRAPTAAALECLAKLALRDRTDPYIRAAVLIAAHGQSPQLAALMKPRLDKAPIDAGTIAWWETFAESELSETEIQSTLDRAIDEPSPLSRAGLRGLARGLARHGRTLTATIAALPDNRREALLKSITAPIQSGKSESERIDAIGMLPLADPEIAAKLLPSLLDASQPEPIQRAVARSLAALPMPEVAASIIERWPSLTPSVRGSVLEAILSRNAWTLTLLDAIATGAIPLAELDSVRRAQLLAHADENIRNRAADLVNRATQSRPDRQALLTAALQVDGDRERGRAFVRQICFACHRVLNEGHATGPDLVTVANRTREDILTHILEPNREVNPAYVVYAVATRDGRTHTGVIAAESSASLTLKRAEGETETIARAEIEEIRSTGLSLMPDDLDKQLDAQALADVASFVRSLGETAR